MVRTTERQRDGAGSRRAGRGPAGEPAGATATAWAAVAVLPLLFVLRPAPTSGQAVQRLDEGTFRIRAGGEVVGTEAFTVRSEGSLVKAVGRIRLDTDTAPFRSLEVRLQADAGFRIQAFRLQPERGSPRLVAAVREGDRIRLQISSDRGVRSQEFVADPDLSVLEPHVAHHYYLLLSQHQARLTSGSALRVPVLLPSLGEKATVAIRVSQPTTLDLGRRVVEATRLEIRFPDQRVVVWRGQGGGILKVEHGDGAWSIERVQESGR